MTKIVNPCQWTEFNESLRCPAFKRIEMGDLPDIIIIPSADADKVSVSWSSSARWEVKDGQQEKDRPGSAD
jgi:hypothetical protein